MKNTDIHIRLSDKELAKIDANATTAKMKRSAYLRHAGCNFDPQHVVLQLEIYKLMSAVYLELSKQGVNLNQIARLFNTYGVEDISKKQLQQAMQNIAEMKEKMDLLDDDIRTKFMR